MSRASRSACCIKDAEGNDDLQFEQADLAMDLADSRYKLGLSSIVEFTQAELQKTEADIADTDARYGYRLALMQLAFALGEKQ